MRRLAGFGLGALLLAAALWLGWELLGSRERPTGSPEERALRGAEPMPSLVPAPVPPARPREERPTIAAGPAPAAADPEPLVAQEERLRLAQAPRPVARMLADVLDETRAQLRAALRSCPAPRPEAARQRLMFHYTLVVREGTARVTRLGKDESDIDDAALERCWLTALANVRFAADADPTETQINETVALAELLAAPPAAAR
ncbi:MAG TPA: hypothetical protein VH877_34255 [Polyangia bacterium]|nr:hypothetical protein [Polyangia bacterium]